MTSCPPARALDPGIKTWIRDRPIPVSTAPSLCLYGTYTCGQRAPGTLCVHGMGSTVGVDAVSLSLFLWAQGVLVPWEEGPLSRSATYLGVLAHPCLHMCASVHVHMYECSGSLKLMLG